MTPASGQDEGQDADEWDEHWANYGDPAEENPANSYRQQVLLQLLGPMPAGSSLVDIGCGQGQLAIALKERFPGVEICGIEESAEGVRRARAAAAAQGVDVRFLRRDLLVQLEEPEHDRPAADFAVCTEVLEHVDDPVLLLRHASEYLAPGCRLALTVPGGPRSAFDKHIGHREHFSASRLRSILEAAGLEVEQSSAAGFPFFNLYKLLVILRGKRLIEDLNRSDADVTSSRLARLLLRFFERTMRWNLLSSPFGWQIVAVARVPQP